MQLQELVDSFGQTFKHVFAQDNPLGLVVVWAITLIFFVSFVGIMSTLAKVGREQKWLDRARRAFGAREDDDALPSTAEEMREVLDLEEAPDNTLVLRLVGDLLLILPLRGFDATLIRTVTGARFEVGGGFARFSAGTLTVIGLVGTILGLSLAVSQLPSLLNGIDSEQGLQAFTSQLMTTLSGMGTAFSCTLAGLTGAVILSLLNYIVRSRQQRVLEDLDTFIYLELAPELVPQHEDHSASAFVDRLDKVGASLETMLGTVLQAAEAMKDGAIRIGKTTEDLAKIAGPMRELATRTIEATEKLDTAIAGLGELQTLPEELRKVAGELSGLSEALRTSLEAGVKTGFADAMTDLRKSMSAEQLDMKRDYADLLAGIQEAVAEMLGQVGEPVQELLQKDADLKQDLVSLADEIRSLTEQFKSPEWRAAAAGAN